MKFYTDSYIEIGKSHETCEDYALSSSIAGVPFAIVSDGCSSSKNTDVGSRLLTYACQNALRKLLLKDMIDNFSTEDLSVFIKDEVLFNLRLSLNALALPETVADATLLLAFIHKDRLYYFIYGDGHIMLKFRDTVLIAGGRGGMGYESISYADNAPPYISYELDVHRKQRFHQQFSAGEVTHRRRFDFDDVNCTMGDWLTSGACACDSIDVNELDAVILTSDGIESYMYGANAGETLDDNISNVKRWYDEYSSYKNVSGEFVKRRMKRIKLNNEKQHIEHYDDVSCATIWIDHEQ
jgi:hypothetical protein